MQTLVTCKVQRSHGTGKLLQLTLYRNGTVGIPLVSISTPEQRGQRKPDSPPPMSEAEAVRNMVKAACEIVTTTTPPAEPFLAPTLQLPVRDGVDIDAIHGTDRQQATVPGDSVASLALRETEPQDFVAALYSDGILVIESNGTVVELPLEHTTKLMHYLDFMRAGDLVHGLKEVL
jgi:hypothetical protein